MLIYSVERGSEGHWPVQWQMGSPEGCRGLLRSCFRCQGEISLVDRYPGTCQYQI